MLGGRSNLEPPNVRDYPPARNNLPPPFTAGGRDAGEKSPQPPRMPFLRHHQGGLPERVEVDYVAEGETDDF